MAKTYNPQEYETVKERKARFYSDHEDGRIEVEITNEDVMEYAFYVARVYTCRDDQTDRLPKGIGTALEIRDKELSVSKQGNPYESVNYTSWSENAEESAVGRALDNAGYSGNRKCSREEMAKTQRHSEVLGNHTTAPQNPPQSGAQGARGHFCEKHNTPFFKKGKMKGYAHPIEGGGGWCNEEDAPVAEQSMNVEELKMIIVTQIEQLGWDEAALQAFRISIDLPAKLSAFKKEDLKKYADALVAEMDGSLPGVDHKIETMDLDIQAHKICSEKGYDLDREFLKFNNGTLPKTDANIQEALGRFIKVISKWPAVENVPPFDERGDEPEHPSRKMD